MFKAQIQSKNCLQYKSATKLSIPHLKYKRLTLLPIIQAILRAKESKHSWTSIRMTLDQRSKNLSVKRSSLRGENTEITHS